MKSHYAIQVKLGELIHDNISDLDLRIKMYDLLEALVDASIEVGKTSVINELFTSDCEV